MKCLKAQQHILREDSHELGVFGAWRLGRHLTGCTACRDYIRDLKRTADRWTHPEGPEDFRIEQILDYGRVHRPDPQPWAWRPLTWRPALATGLSLLLLAAVWIGREYPGATPSAACNEEMLQEKLAQVHQILSTVDGSLQMDTPTGGVALPEDVNETALMLLMLEG